MRSERFPTVFTWLTPLFLGCIVAFWSGAAQAQRVDIDTAVIPMNSLTMEDVQPIIESMLTKDGKLGYFKQRNSLIVHDTPASIEAIKKVIAKLDQPSANIRIEVEFLNDVLQKGSNIKLTADGGAPTVVIDHGDVKVPNRWELSGNNSTQTTRKDTSQFVMTRSGMPAKLWVGEQVRDAEFLRKYQLIDIRDGKIVNRREGWDADFVWRDVGASLYVKPTYMDNGFVDIEVYPVVTTRTKKGDEVSYKVAEVSTHVLARHGERVLIGGNDQQTREFMRQLLGPDLYRKESISDTLSMYLTPYVRLMDRAAPVERASDGPDTWRPGQARGAR